MKGRIAEDGALEIIRGGVPKLMSCRAAQGWLACGDDCPLFGEPEKRGESGKVMLTLCHNRNLFFDEFEDLRLNNGMED